MDRYANVYRKSGKWYAHPSSWVRDGFLLATEPFIALPAGASAADLGGMIRRALGGSREGIENPGSGYTLQPLYRLAGVGSWRAFARSVEYIQVIMGSDAITFVPQQLAEPESSFTGVVDAAKAVPVTASDSALGTALLHAIEQREVGTTACRPQAPS